MPRLEWDLNASKKMLNVQMRTSVLLLLKMCKNGSSEGLFPATIQVVSTGSARRARGGTPHKRIPLLLFTQGIHRKRGVMSVAAVLNAIYETHFVCPD